MTQNYIMYKKKGKKEGTKACRKQGWREAGAVEGRRKGLKGR